LRSVKYLQVAVLVIIAVSPVFLFGFEDSSLFVYGDNHSVKLVRSPLEVYSGQEALIFAYIQGDVKKVSLSLSVNIRLLKDDVVEKEFPIEVLGVPMLAVPWAKGWYITALPGLPAKTVVIERVLLPSVTWKVVSSVSYKLIIDGGESASGGYVIKEGEVGRRLPPLLFASVYEALDDPRLIGETLGLGPRGWRVGAYEDQKIIIVAIDNEGVENVSFEYSVSGGVWSDLTVTEDPLISSFEDLIDKLDDTFRLINSIMPDMSLRETKAFIDIYNAVIPGQPAGNYVMFKAEAIDMDGNKATSPRGFYFSVNQATDTRVLVVDPHIKLWVLQENLNQLVKNFRVQCEYELPSDILDNMTSVSRATEAVNKYGITPFHHWELLGKNYELYVAWPNEEVADLLKSRVEGGYEPDVIILSNLAVGLNETGASKSWSWDLQDLGVQDDLIRYVKEKHAGLIATHGTLSDWVVWDSPEPNEHYKVRCRGHIGETIKNIVDEDTIAALLGVPELALWEFVRDKVAYALCADPYTEPLGLLVGSIPLQVTHIPFNGLMKTTPEVENLGWEIPDEFTVEVPSVYNEFNIPAYTQIGWQLAMPRALTYNAWRSAEGSRVLTKRIYGKLSGLVENITTGMCIAERVMEHTDSSLRYGLRNFYRSLATANISDTKFSMTVNIPDLGKNITLNVDLGEAFHKLLQFLPVKIISVSKDGLAGIVVNDRYWDRDGHRSVYFSFEVEAAEGDVAEQLLTQAVEWTRQWKFKGITELLGNAVRASKEIAEKFRETVDKTLGSTVLSKPLLLNEEGCNLLKLTSKQGLLHLVIAHPTSEKVNMTITRGNATVIEVSREGVIQVTEITVEVCAEGSLEFSVKADPESSLNPVYVEVKEEVTTTLAPMPSPTPTPITTPSPAPTPTPTGTPVPSPTPTPYSSPTPTPTPLPSPTPEATPPLTPGIVDYIPYIIAGVVLAAFIIVSLTICTKAR